MTPSIAIVTGGASGIGRALCSQLAQRGAIVVVADRDFEGAQRVAEAIGGEAAELDVTDAAGFDALVADVIARHGRLDWLFNNAGVGAAGLVDDLTPADWKRVIDVNLWGVIHGVSAAYPRMVAQGFGHIVNTASGAGLAPRPGMTAYATAKSGVVGLSMSLRAEGAAHGVRVSVACPGYVATNIMADSEYTGLDGKSLVDAIPIRPMTAEACARIIVDGAEKNRAVIVDSVYVWLDWLLMRLSPRLATRVASLRATQFRAHRSPVETPLAAK